MRLETIEHEDIEQMARQIVRLRALLDDLTAASFATLHTINRVGGYHVFDPVHQGEVATVLQAQAQAVFQAMEA